MLKPSVASKSGVAVMVTTRGLEVTDAKNALISTVKTHISSRN
jgi:hypothetical protein